MTSFQAKELARREAFEGIWDNQINDVFADVAAVYDKANDFASLGTLKGLRRRLSTLLISNQVKRYLTSVPAPMLSVSSY